MTTTININVNGYGVQTAQESTDRQLPTNGDRQLSGSDVFRWQDAFYTLLPGFTPTRYLYSERKLKKKKKKNCSNGQVCGFSCISKTKVCIADMTTAQLMEHNKAKRLERREKARAKRLAAKGGGAGGALAVLDKPKAEETVNGPKFKGDRQAEIDKKYAGVDPSAKDVDNWFKETRENLFTPEGMEAMAARSLFFDTFSGESAALPFLDKVNNERAYVQAASVLLADKYVNRQWTAPNGKTYSSQDIEYWRAHMKPFTAAEDQKKLERAQRVVDNPKKTADQKAKAQKQIDRIRQKQDEAEELAQTWHKRTVGLASGDPQVARQIAQEFWNNSIAQNRSEARDALKSFESRSKTNQEYARTWMLGKVELLTNPKEFLMDFSGKDLKDYAFETAKARLMSLNSSSPLSSATTKAELKSLFKAYARENHPDKGGDTKAFQAVSAQYQEMLSYLN